ncbi:hypothetical protein GF391_03195 [Candidatus Uhrbacteria bacterium]|nr:hypothetical protein [Candidatus Uhrbacteria bacterium]
MLNIAKEHHADDFLTQTQESIETLRLWGVGRFPILITEYEWPIQNDMAPLDAMHEVLARPEESIDYRAWLYLVNGETIINMLSSLYDTLRNRAGQPFIENEDRVAIFFEVKAGENLANVFYSTTAITQPLSRNAWIS